ncbi:MAG: hypothetical protein IID33_12500 [Planctomycetes bacterium]|nr:hypothetical protein [Planctomycetota bacterium]
MANEADRNAALEPEGDVFVGTWPLAKNIVNSAVVWSGKQWTMVMWPLPVSKKPRARLLAHEMWHRIQNNIGLSAIGADNGHLDTPSGRIWMRLEWRAWSRAIGSAGEERREAIGDALGFRAMRRSLCKGASKAERTLENNEALAEYTGVVLAGWSKSELAKQIQDDLAEADKGDSFVRSFAYHTGPVIGVLLDEIKPDWSWYYNRSNELPARLRVALKIAMPKDLTAFAESRMKLYGGDKIREEERLREGRRQQRLAAARAKFIDGPTLRIRLVNMKIQFDPNTLQPLDRVGAVYPTLRIRDVWGTLEVEDGALVAAGWKSLTVSVAPDWDGKVTERKGAWKLDLQWPWRIERAKKSGNWVLTR